MFFCVVFLSNFCFIFFVRIRGVNIVEIKLIIIIVKILIVKIFESFLFLNILFNKFKIVIIVIIDNFYF